MKQVLAVLILGVLLIACSVGLKDSKIGKNKLRFEVDSNFFEQVDTTNWQYVYEANKMINFNKKFIVKSV